MEHVGRIQEEMEDGSDVYGEERICYWRDEFVRFCRFVKKSRRWVRQSDGLVEELRPKLFSFLYVMKFGDGVLLWFYSLTQPGRKLNHGTKS